jgi:hypothetical protein
MIGMEKNEEMKDNNLYLNSYYFLFPRPSFPEIVDVVEEIFKQALQNKDFMKPAVVSRDSLRANHLVRMLQGVKKKRFPTLARTKTDAGVVVNVHNS